MPEKLILVVLIRPLDLFEETISLGFKSNMIFVNEIVVISYL